MFCPKCGKQIPDSSKFCGGCGNPVKLPPGAGQAPVPEKAVKAEPEMTAKAEPEKAVKTEPEMTAKTEPEMTVKAEPEMTAKAEPEKAAQTVPENIPMPQREPVPENISMQPREPQKQEGSRLVVVLAIVLAVLVLILAGLGVYYFVLDGNLGNVFTRFAGTEEEPEDELTDEEEDTEEESEAEEESEDPAEAEASKQEEEPAEEAVVSDTNEVVAGQILENIPKAVYSYRFDGTLDGAQVVIREEPETEPEIADDTMAGYVSGMDGEAVLLDGTCGLKLSNVESLGDSYTVAFWVNAKELHDWSPLIHVGRNCDDEATRSRLWICQKPDGKHGSVGPILSSERVEVGDSVEIRPDNSGLSSLSEGVWYHIAFTVDGSKQGSRSGRLLGSLYVAGIKIGQGDVVENAMNGEGFEVYLGINNWDDLYPVAFDDVKIWNQALSEEQIVELCEAYK